MKNMDIIEIEFKDTDTTPDRLIKATQALIAVYGYDATTTRMIANLAKVTLSAINFHFGNKENLVREAMSRAAQELELHYSKLAGEIRRFLEEEPVDREKAWSYLDRILTDRIRRAFDRRASWINIGIAEHENGLPESSRGIMARTAVEGSERILAELILAVSDKKNAFQAALISRAVNAAIMSYSEKPLLNQYLEESLGVDLSDPRRVEECLHDYFMTSIAAAVGVDPHKKIV